MDVKLVPTAIPSQWRDNGTGTWSISGSTTGFGGACPWMSTTTTVTGTGGFLTGAGDPSTGQAALLLTGFDPAGATGMPALSWLAKGTGTTPTFIDGGLPGTCLPAGVAVADYPFGIPAPGASGTYTGTTSAGRGVTFSYGEPTTTQVTGSLTPVP